VSGTRPGRPDDAGAAPGTGDAGAAQRAADLAAAPTAPTADRSRVAVKICGVTDPASAVLCAELGAAFLGLNFWPGSPRWLDLGLAREIAAAVRAVAPRVALVGVFVHPGAAEIAAADRAAGLDLLQFSGDEPAAAVAPHAARALKALRLSGWEAPAGSEESAVGAVSAISAVSAGMATNPLAGFESCWGVLLDTPRARGAAAGGGDYGGTGRAWDHATARVLLPGFERRRVFLAGGLGPANVRRVLERIRPFAVDVCSGVESAPGKKDPQLLGQLFEEVFHAQVITGT
jgi:phosphoribosylanthranilate isomerase